MAIQKVTNQVMKHGIIQVQTVAGTDTQATTSGTFVDYPGMSITMNVREGSKILVRMDGVFLHKTAGNFTYGQFLRDGGVAFTASSKGLTVTSATMYSPITQTAWKDGETAGSHTYKWQYRVDGGTGEAYGQPVMTIMEIAQ